MYCLLRRIKSPFENYMLSRIMDRNFLMLDLRVYHLPFPKKKYK
ncbi:hypothetical protein HMPREF1548_06225 [Clostridium sp. KLE 1755]|nr:hypothetical protein HMPREF1548_06225 [Clostridium sp. KLE 1755]